MKMKSFLCVDLLLCAIIVILALTSLSHAELEQSKNRRAGGTSGLFLFPRVGRNDPSMVNNVRDIEATSPLTDNYYNAPDDEYDDLSKGEFKRANLKLYPRVGRTDAELRKWAHLMALQQAIDRRATGPSSTSGLWFGPRLGKRSIHTQDDNSHKSQHGQGEHY